MLFHNIIGNDFAKEILAGIIKNNKCVSSYIFYGAEGVGKKLFAMEFAKSVLCTNGEIRPCGNCANCLKMNNGGNENCKIIDMDDMQSKKDNEEKYISAVREIEKYLNFRAANSGKKVVIINSVEKCSTEALNAILKTLEEPPSYAVIILIANNIFALPLTVISRCQTIKFHPIAETDIVGVLCKKFKLIQSDASLIALLSEGSIGIAANIAQNTLSEYKDAYITLQKCIASRNFYQRKGLIPKSSDSNDAKEKAKQIIKLMIFALRQDLLRNEMNTESLVASIEELFHYSSYIDNNANSKLVLENALIDVEQAISE